MKSQLNFYLIRKKMHSNQHSSQRKPLHTIFRSFHSFELSPSAHFRTQGPYKVRQGPTQSALLSFSPIQPQSLCLSQPPSLPFPGPLHSPLFCWCPTGSFHSNVTFPVTTVIFLSVLPVSPFLLYLSTKRFTFQQYTRLIFVSSISI